MSFFVEKANPGNLTLPVQFYLRLRLKAGKTQVSARLRSLNNSLDEATSLLWTSGLWLVGSAYKRDANNINGCHA
jgi:hypothetical protein